jgi:hypothetical protein
MTKVLVSLDQKLLERLDREAAGRGLSRSALIQELAAKGLGEPVGPGANAEVHEALRQAAELLADLPDTGDSTDWIRAERDARR